MYYMFIKMSSKWFCKKMTSLSSEAVNVEAHIANGDTVILVDDIEEFCDMMDVEQDEIEMVE